jgi:hypothetical protein
LFGLSLHDQSGTGEVVVAILATAYVALSCWAVANWGRALQSWHLARLAWSLGALANLGHVLLAFHLFHEWNNAKAQAAIARQTYEQVGWEWNGGIFVNYAFCALWSIDAAFWWIAPNWYLSRSSWLNDAVQFTCLFMFANATVVFGKSRLWILGAALCLIGTAGYVQARRAMSQRL